MLAGMPEAEISAETAKAADEAAIELAQRRAVASEKALEDGNPYEAIALVLLGGFEVVLHTIESDGFV